MAHVFISYVRDDQKRVDALVAALRAVGIEVWIDKSSIKPGERWQKAIRDAITSGTFFIACFSRASHARMKSYMSEELTIALDDLRMRPANRTWFIPVRLEDVEIPDLPINRRESITDLQWVDLHQDWERGIGLLIDAIQPEIPVSVVLDAVSQDRFALDALLKESFADQLQQSHTVVPVLGMHACTTVAEAVRLAARKTIQVTGRPLDVTDFDDISNVIDSLAGYRFHESVGETVQSLTLDSCPIYRTIAALPVPAFLNTTFDDLLLRALTEAGKAPTTYRASWRTYQEAAEDGRRAMSLPESHTPKLDGMWIPRPTVHRDQPRTLFRHLREAHLSSSHYSGVCPTGDRFESRKQR